MRVAKRIPPYTKPAKRLLPKIPNPLPKTAGTAQLTEYGCLFTDLRAKTPAPPSDPTQLPPLLSNPVGKIIAPKELEKMKELYQQDAHRWTIAALAKRFGIHRSFVIRQVMSQEDREQLDQQLVTHIDALTLQQKRGWLMRYKIREHRNDSW